MEHAVVFVDVDTQHDFMDPGGALYVPGAEEIVPNLERLTRLAGERDLPLLATLDTHRPDDPEFARFPPHCVKGTPGWRKIPATDAPHAERFEKNTFDPFTNPAFEARLAALGPSTAVVYGVAVEYCVKAAALGLLERIPRVILVRDAVRAVDPAAGAAALAGLRSRGARELDTEAVFRMLEGDGG